MKGMTVLQRHKHSTSLSELFNTHRHRHAPVDRHVHTAGPVQCLAIWVITGIRSRFTAEAVADDFQHRHQHRELCSCDLQNQLHRSMTGNKRPWKSQYNDYGEENYSYISGWATRLQLYIHFGADLVIVKAPAVNLSYLYPSGLYGTPLSDKSSVQHIHTSVTWTGLKESWLDDYQWPAWNSTHLSSGLWM